MSPRKKCLAPGGTPVHNSPAWFKSTAPPGNSTAPIFLDFDSKASVIHSLHNHAPDSQQLPLRTAPVSAVFSAMDSSPSHNVSSLLYPQNVESNLPSPMGPTGLDKSLHEMNMHSYTIRDEIQANLVSDTTTDTNYARYVRDYTLWWANNEALLCNTDPTRVPIPAMPITAGKVITFLNYELKRPKRKAGAGSESVAGTNVGSSVIKGAVSALEKIRCRDAHLYPNDPEARLPLRSDDRIKRAEAAVKHNEPARVAQSQTLKAAGSSSDTYTIEELTTLSMWCLTEPKTRHALITSLRDRAMHLLCTATAFRGDNARVVGLSDLFLRDVPNVSAGYDSKIMSLRILCDNAKHNQSGKVEEQGAIRHRIPALCAIGALAMHFFSLFHILGQPLQLAPDFSSDAQEAGFGEYGRREWYTYKAFFATNISQAMSYQNHAARIKHMHEKNDIAISKVTHAGRVWSALIMRQFGTNVPDAKAIGQWSAAGAFGNCYDRELPLEGLLGAAMFNAHKPEGHFLARATLAPPPQVVSQIFPWVEEQASALKARYAANPKALDLSLQSFLDLLIALRTVLVQDLAALYDKGSNSLIFSFPPFNTIDFRVFAEQASAEIAQAEASASAALQNLPEYMAQTLRGIVQNSVSAQKAHASIHETRFESLEQALFRMEGHLGMISERPGKRKRTNAVTSINPPVSTPPFAQQIPLHLPPMLSPTPPPFAAAADDPPIEPSPPQPSTHPVHLVPPGPELPAYSTVPTTSPASSLPTQSPLAPVPTSRVVSAPVLTTILTTPSARATITTFSASTGSEEETQKTLKWAPLVEKYGEARLRKHQWEWVGRNWVPYYEVQTITSLGQLWDEYANGINGFLPVRALHERWGKKPAWHRNVGAKKTDYGRRKKVAHLIEDLSKRPRWGIDYTLNFLDSTYGGRYTAGTFSRWLCETKKNGEGANMRAVLEEADKYKAKAS